MRAAPSALLRYRFPALPGIFAGRVPLRVLLRPIQVRPEPESNQPRRLGIGQYILAQFSPNLILPAIVLEHRMIDYWWRRWLHASGF
jgi:hypothetical protein